MLTPSGVPIPEPIPLSHAVLNTLRASAARMRVPRIDRESIRCASDVQDIRLNFGTTKSSAKNPVVIGGSVKLLALKKRFGEWLEEFNILYLVSSALPAGAVDFVQTAMSRGAKLVWNQNGIAYPGWCGWKYPWMNETMVRLLPEADHVIYQSEFCRRSADRYLGNNTQTSEILFNPVDVSIFKPSAEPPSLECWKLLTAGTSHNFYRTKASLDCLIELLRRKRNGHLTITGELRWQGAQTEVDEYIETNGIRAHVSFRPAFSRDKAPEVYIGQHLLLHPKDKDPCPTVPIEAMASGLPVVGSRSGGMPELVSHTCGRLVDVVESWTEDHAPDAGKMADGVEEIFENWSIFSKAARTHACSAFDESSWLDAHERIFRNVLGLS